jgi:hypothetical protein
MAVRREEQAAIAYKLAGNDNKSPRLSDDKSGAFGKDSLEEFLAFPKFFVRADLAPPCQRRSRRDGLVLLWGSHQRVHQNGLPASVSPSQNLTNNCADCTSEFASTPPGS